MDWGTIYTVWLREMIRFSRDKYRFIGGLVTPLLFFIIMGFGLGDLVKGFSPNGNYFSFLLPGIIGQSLLFTSIFSGVSVIYDRQFGFLKEMLVAPVSRTSIVLGKVLGSATIALLGGVLILVMGIIFSIIPLATLSVFSIVMALVFMLLISSAFVSLGTGLAAKMNSMEGFQFVMSFLVMPAFLLSGVFFPIQALPDWLKGVAFLDPLMYGVDAVRSTLIGSGLLPIWISFVVLLAFNFVMVWWTASLFQKMGA